MCAAAFFAGCSQTENVSHVVIHTPEEKYIPLHDNLYTDDAGNLYHRTMDRSLMEGEPAGSATRYAYRNYIWKDTVINGEETLETVNLKSVIDVATFHKTGNDPSTRSEYYADKNRSYSIVINYDGGTLKTD